MEDEAWTDYMLQNRTSDLIKEHQNVFDAFKAKYGDQEPEDSLLVRFLAAWKYDVQDASKNIETALAWKKENEFVHLMERTRGMTVEEFPHYHKMRRFLFEKDCYCEDKHGNQVTISSMSAVNPTVFVHNVTLEEFNAFMLHVFARKIGRMLTLSKERGYLVREFRIVDARGLSMSHIASDLVTYLKNVLKPAQTNFPEHMYRCYIINAPGFFSLAWKIIRKFLSERSQKKIQILGSKYHDVLDAEIPQHIDMNAVFSDVEEEEGFVHLYIAKRSQQHVVLKVNAGDRVRWEFRTTEKDIAFRIHCGGKDICSHARVDAYKHIQEGEWTATQDGDVVVCFDNTYSAFTSKVVIYKLWVLD